MTTRRQFIVRSGTAAGGLMALSHFPLLKLLPQAMAQTAPDRFFVLLSMEGGWDVTLSLDPWTQSTLPDPEDLFIEYPADEVFRSGDLVLGPAAKPLQKHATDISTINGLILSDSDNGHFAALNYMSTGTTVPDGSDLGLAFADCCQSGPFGVISGRYSLVRGGSSILVSPVQDILNSRSGKDPISLLPEGGESGTPLLEAIRLLLSTSEIRSQFASHLSDMEKKQTLQPYHVAAAAFLSGAAAQAELQIDGVSLDTHSNHEKTHLESQKSGWQKVSDIFDFFKATPFGTSGRSLFDHTTFMVISEFSRTPALNSSKGKDHNPILNSVLLAGAGIQGGRTVGGSRLVTRQQSETRQSIHMGAPFDFSTGRILDARENASFIFPENVAITIATAMGADLQRFRSVSADTQLVPGIVR